MDTHFLQDRVNEECGRKYAGKSKFIHIHVYGFQCVYTYKKEHRTKQLILESTDRKLLGEPFTFIFCTTVSNGAYRGRQRFYRIHITSIRNMPDEYTPVQKNEHRVKQ